MDSSDKFEETLKLPPREQFYSHLKEESVREADYAHVQKAWIEFNIQKYTPVTRPVSDIRRPTVSRCIRKLSPYVT